MNIKHLPFHLGFGLALGSSLLLLGIAPQAQAQQSNLSDVTGFIITTSDTALFRPGTGRRTIAFTTGQIQTAVNQAATSVNAQLAAGTLPVVARGISATSIPTTAQQALESVLTGIGNVDANVNQIASALTNGACAIDPTLARNQAKSFQGLTAGGRVNPAKLAAAVRAYNAVINASSRECLANPPGELLGIQTVLATLLSPAFVTGG